MLLSFRLGPRGTMLAAQPVWTANSSSPATAGEADHPTHGGGAQDRWTFLAKRPPPLAVLAPPPPDAGGGPIGPAPAAALQHAAGFSICEFAGNDPPPAPQHPGAS